jgi:hypothetical protein
VNRLLPASIGLISAALLSFQIVLLQAFSSVQWYHFAYMVISVALLGFGASGTALTIARSWFERHYTTALFGALLASASSMPVSLAMTQLPPARFDSYLLLTDVGQAGSLVITYVVLSIPFFCGALAIGLAFMKYTTHMGPLYFANLMGSGAGGVLGLGLLYTAPPPSLAAVTGLLATAAGALLLRRDSGARAPLALIAVLLLNTALLVKAPHLRPSEYKDQQRAMLMPGVETLETAPHAMGTISILRSNLFRDAPGLSLAYRGEVPSHDLLFVNGDAARTMDGPEHVLLREFTTSALPYVTGSPDTVLILGGIRPAAVGLALKHGARSVTISEPHSGIRRAFASGADSVWMRDRRVEIYAAEARTLLAQRRKNYDLAVLPHVGSFGGTSGLTALQEQYDLTVEALDLLWRRISDDGSIAATAWVDYPARNPLRLIATLTEMLDRNGLRPRRHLIAVRSWGSITVVATKRPAAAYAGTVRTWADSLLFDPLILPELPSAERLRHNALQDTTLLQAVDSVLTGNRSALYKRYPFRISPATDDRPYFSQFLRWNHLADLKSDLGLGLPFFEIGTLTVAVTLVQVVLVAILLIVLPLMRIGWSGAGRSWTLVYFGGLAIGFMFLELIAIQRFTMYLGHPVVAVTFVFTVLLISSGLGSLASSRWSPDFRNLRTVAGRVAVALALFLLILGPVTDATIGLPMPMRLVFGTVLLAPAAFLMGFPFPLGLRALEVASRGQVPWGWAINGSVSVAGAPAALLLAAELGAIAVLLIATLFYLIAAMASRILKTPGS